MELIQIEGTAKTPYVMLNAHTGTIELRGRSISEDTTKFYNEIFVWLNNYIQAPCNVTTVNIQLDYFNSNSSRCILSMLKTLENIVSSTHSVSVNWFYEDEDDEMFEAPDFYESLVKIPFNKIKIITPYSV
jgi:hypothetical protein